MRDREPSLARQSHRARKCLAQILASQAWQFVLQAQRDVQGLRRAESGPCHVRLERGGSLAPGTGAVSAVPRHSLEAEIELLGARGGHRGPFISFDKRAGNLILADIICGARSERMGSSTVAFRARPRANKRRRTYLGRDSQGGFRPTISPAFKDDLFDGVVQLLQFPIEALDARIACFGAKLQIGDLHGVARFSPRKVPDLLITRDIAAQLLRPLTHGLPGLDVAGALSGFPLLQRLSELYSELGRLGVASDEFHFDRSGKRREEIALVRRIQEPARHRVTGPLALVPAN